MALRTSARHPSSDAPPAAWRSGWLAVVMLVAACSGAPADADAAGALGEHECRVIEGGCQADCHAMRATVYEVAAACQRDVAVFACSRSLGGTGATGCSVNEAEGLYARFTGEAFYEPYFTGWTRPCSEEEIALMTSADACP